MRYFTSLLFTTLLMLLSAPAWSQRLPAILRGTVKDNFTNERIDGAYLYLLRPDSTVIDSIENKLRPNIGVDSKSIRFDFEVPEQKGHRFILKVSHPGYRTLYMPVTLAWKKSQQLSFFFWDTYLTPLPHQQILEEVTVTATKVKFYHKGDTLVYNADAFQLQEGSMLDALVEQLPGAEIKSDGRIMVNGKFVESLLLNGRDFFKGDNTILLDNLPAYMVKNVQVYHKESEDSRLTGKKMDEGVYVMDVKLKRQYEAGWLANAELGGGTSDRYLARLFGMRFTPQSHLTLFGNLNNVNDRRKPDVMNGNWSDFEVTVGVTSGKRTGLSYNVEDKHSRYRLSGDAEVNYTDNVNNMGGNSADFYENGNAYNSTDQYASNTNLSVSTSHAFEFTFQKPNKPYKSLLIKPSFNYSKSDAESQLRNGTFGTLPAGGYEEVLDSLFSPNWTHALRDLVKRNRQQATGHENHINGSLYVRAYHDIPFTNKGISLEGNAYIGHTGREKFNHFLYNYYDNEALQTDYRNRYINSPTDNRKYNVSARFVNPFGKGFHLNPSIGYSYIYLMDKDQHYRLDVLGDDTAEQPLGWLPSQADALLKALDHDNSYRGRLRRYGYRVGLNFQWTHNGRNKAGESHSWYLQINSNLWIQKDDYLFMGTPQDQQVDKKNLLPNANIQLKRKTPGQRHELEYKATFTSSAPTPTNLIDKTFTDNPLNITQGNPGLKPMHTLSTSFSYRAAKWLEESGRQLSASIGYEQTYKAIGVATTYNPNTGVTTSRPDNINGNWFTWGYLYFNTPIDKQRRLSLTTTTRPYYYHNVDFVSDQPATDPIRTVRKTFNLEETLRLHYRYKKVSLSLKGSATWMHGISDMADFSTVNTWSFNYGPSAMVDLPAHFQLSTELTMFTRRGYESAEMNRNDLVWNARLSKSVIDSRLTFMLDAYDILGNLSNMVYGLNSRSRWEYYYNVIPRYGLLRIAYKFSKQPVKKR